MKKILTVSAITKFLSLVLTFLGILLALDIFSIIGIKLNIYTFTKFCLGFIIYSLYYVTVYNLRGIVYSINLNPFCIENIKRLNLIGYCMFIVAIMDGIINYSSKDYSGFVILGTSYGSLKLSFFLYIILAFTALILAEIFKRAVEIKKENDLTI